MRQLRWLNGPSDLIVLTSKRLRHMLRDFPIALACDKKLDGLKLVGLIGQSYCILVKRRYLKAWNNDFKYPI